MVAVSTEDRREVLGPDDTQHRVGVGERERAVVAVANRSGVGTGRLGADTQAAAVKREQRSAPCGDRVHVDDRRTDADARHLGLVRPLELAGEVGDVSGRAAHVKADEPLEAGCLGGAGHADDTPGRTRQQCIAAGEAPSIGQTAIGLHELQLRPPCRFRAAIALRSVAAADPRCHGIGCADSRRDSVGCADSRCHGIDVAAQDRGQVGVGHGGVAAGDDLDQRVHLVAHRDLLETDLTSRSSQRCLVVGVPVAVHQHDGHRLHASLPRRGHAVCGRRQIQRAQHRAVRGDALVHLEHLRIEHLGQHDVELEQVRAGLVADAQHVAEARRGDEQRRHAAALQQRIGGHRGAHLHRPDPVWRQRLAPRHAEQIGDGGGGCVVVAARVLAQQLVRDEAAVGPPGHDISEGAATIHPEVPAKGCSAHGRTLRAVLAGVRLTACSQSGTTAVAMISTIASGSTSPVVPSSAIAGKCRLRCLRWAAPTPRRSSR